MWSVQGKRHASNYPGYSNDPIDGFRHLAADLEEFGQAFLAADSAEFLEHVAHAAMLKIGSSRLPP
jgi:hypothetical protein